MNSQSFMAAFILILSGVAAASPTPETLVHADVQSREKTLDGMQLQIELRRQNASEAVLMQAAVANQEGVEAVFASFGLTGARHSAEWTRQRAAVEAWLETHTQWQQTYQDLDAQFQALSQQLDSLRAAP
jgi:hypothetical protein